MANNIATTSSPLPANGKTLIRDAQWGIDTTLSGFIIQTADWSSEPIYDTTQDQKGAVVSELDYDMHYSCTITVVGSGTLPAVGSIDFQFPIDDVGGAKKNWKVMSVVENGSFQDKKKYTISLERYTNFPS